MEFKQKQKEVIEELIRNSPDGVHTPSPSKFPNLYSKAQRHFGSFYKAAEASGLKIKNPRYHARGKKKDSINTRNSKKKAIPDNKLNIGDRIIHTKVKEKLLHVNKRRGTVCQIYKDFVVVKFDAGYHECFLKWDIEKGKINFKKQGVNINDK